MMVPQMYCHNGDDDDGTNIKRNLILLTVCYCCYQRTSKHQPKRQLPYLVTLGDVDIT